MTTKIERRLLNMAAEHGITVSATELHEGIENLVGFLRTVKKLKDAHDERLRNFGSDQFRKTRQRILAASAGITPIRICHAAANENTARICAY